MNPGGRILVLGGHEFNRRSGNDAVVEAVVELADSSRPRVCLLPTASGDPEDQIASFRRSFGARGVTIEAADELHPALVEALQSNLPTVIHAPMENAPTPTPGHWDINDVYRAGD